MKPIRLLLLSLLPLPAIAGTPDAATDAGLRAVVESFRTAIIQRDKPRFLGLFVEGPVTWRSVKSEDTLRRVQAKNPKATKAPFNPASSPLSFIDGIVADAKASEEKFDNLRIDSDGEVAAVSFDYSFHSNGTMTNFGQESWMLLRTGAGWRIASVVWSVRLPPQD